MRHKNSIGVFISGRLGSERLPRKLVLPIGETCLWDIACKKLNGLPDKYRKYVLAEKGDLADIAKKHANLEVIIRDNDTAIADSPLTFIFKDIKDVPSKYLMFLNPCQSFITSATIISSLEKFEKSIDDIFEGYGKKFNIKTLALISYQAFTSL